MTPVGAARLPKIEAPANARIAPPILPTSTWSHRATDSRGRPVTLAATAGADPSKSSTPTAPRPAPPTRTQWPRVHFGLVTQRGSALLVDASFLSYLHTGNVYIAGQQCSDWPRVVAGPQGISSSFRAREVCSVRPLRSVPQLPEALVGDFERADWTLGKPAPRKPTL